MTQPSPQERRTPARRPRLNLPFDNRRQDAGTWAYEHRVGLCVTLIAYLVLMIVFVVIEIKFFYLTVEKRHATRFDNLVIAFWRDVGHIDLCHAVGSYFTKPS